MLFTSIPRMPMLHVFVVEMSDVATFFSAHFVGSHIVGCFEAIEGDRVRQIDCYQTPKCALTAGLLLINIRNTNY